MENKKEWVVDVSGYSPADISHLSEKQLIDLKLKIQNFFIKEFLPLYQAKKWFEFRDLTTEEEIETAKKSNCILAMLTKSNYPNENESIQGFNIEYIIKLFYVNHHYILSLFTENLEKFVNLAKNSVSIGPTKVVCVDNRFYNKFEPKDEEAFIYFCNYKELMDSYILRDKNWIINKFFVFNHIRYEHLVFLLRTQGIIISGGTHNRRHIISPLELSLALNLLLFFNISNKIHKEKVNYTNYISESFHHKSFKEKDYSYKNKLLQFIEICKLIYNYVDEKNNKNSRRCRILYTNTFYCSMDVTVQDDGVVVQPNSTCVEFFQELLNKVEKRIEILRSETNALQNGNN
uniref:Uncharacterized protein n=1 Tax=Ganoderma sinense TaxID=36075 RepID=V5KWS0_9APHY|nr:hypothetical protein Gasi_Mp28 [Ganoderma sinense]AHA41738.1 hypothetical protein Gasi_Mp28 [Ganoderma sinense]